MSPQPSIRNRPSVARRAAFGLAAVILGVAGTMAVLIRLGIMPLPWQPRVAAKPRPQGVPIPLAARLIPAFTLVTREHVMDAKTADFVVIYLPPEQVAAGGLLTIDKIVGRVLRKDHNPGYGFAEKDFYPKGTRPGLSAGVPPGKVLFTLEAEKVMGIRGLHIGDRIDLLATMEIDHSKALQGVGGKGMMSPALYDAQKPMTNLPKRAGVMALVQDGVMVSPPAADQVPVPGSPVGHNGKPKTKTIEEVKIAVDPREVAPLTEALAVRALVFCVAHSGSPEDTIVPTPGAMPPPPIKTIEVIVAGKRDILVFPNRDEERRKEKAPERYTPGKGKSPAEQKEVKPTTLPGEDDGQTAKPGK